MARIYRLRPASIKKQISSFCAQGQGDIQAFQKIWEAVRGRGDPAGRPYKNVPKKFKKGFEAQQLF